MDNEYHRRNRIFTSLLNRPPYAKPKSVFSGSCRNRDSHICRIGNGMRGQPDIPYGGVGLFEPCRESAWPNMSPLLHVMVFAVYIGDAPEPFHSFLHELKILNKKKTARAIGGQFLF